MIVRSPHRHTGHRRCIWRIIQLREPRGHRDVCDTRLLLAGDTLSYGLVDARGRSIIGFAAKWRTGL